MTGWTKFGLMKLKVSFTAQVANDMVKSGCKYPFGMQLHRLKSLKETVCADQFDGLVGNLGCLCTCALSW